MFLCSPWADFAVAAAVASLLAACGGSDNPARPVAELFAQTNDTNNMVVHYLRNVDGSPQPRSTSMALRAPSSVPRKVTRTPSSLTSLRISTARTLGHLGSHRRASGLTRCASDDHLGSGVKPAIDRDD